jgi:hypothetical protein
MRVCVAVVVGRGEGGVKGILQSVLRVVAHAQENENTRRAADKAIEVLRQAVDADTFTKEWTAILTEEDEKRRKEKEIEAELEPEALKKKIAEERKKKKLEERKKRYWEDTGERGTLHPFGEDGKPVERIPLPREFQ